MEVRMPAVVIEPLLSAGATSEMIAAATQAWGVEYERSRADRRAKGAARMKRLRARRRDAHANGGAHGDAHAHPPGDAHGDAHTVEVLLGTRLYAAADGNVVDLAVPCEPIEELLEQGCDLDLDVVPTIARMVPSLPRPLRSWDAPWLVKAILEARDRRLRASPTTA
jgi:hypothetical protein